MKNKASIDPGHIHQKKKKIVTEFPNGLAIPFQMQRMVDKGLKLITSVTEHNYIVEAMMREDKKDGPMFEEGPYQLYVLANTVAIIDNDDEEIWVTKDSDTTELNPEYWNRLIKQ